MADNAAPALQQVQAKIDAAARNAGRNVADVTLVAVSKTKPVEQIKPLIALGHRSFGENRVQEAQGKWPDLKSAHPDIELHLIGPLQTNKVTDAVALFDVIETVDRPKLARKLADQLAATGKQMRLFVQVNTGEEEQKAGVAPKELPDFLTYCQAECGLSIAGLMCIPPIDEEPALHFALLHKLAGEAGLSKLSMGMSSDFETAVRHGATHVRVGTALFGARA